MSTTLRQAPRKELGGGLSTVPATTTDVTTSRSYIKQIVVANKTAGAVTFTVTDRASSAKTLVPTIPIPANTIIIMSFPDMVQMNDGIAWEASAGSSLDAEIFGYYE